jgi:phospholipid-binding lipoprotein MlaA
MSNSFGSALKKLSCLLLAGTMFAATGCANMESKAPQSADAPDGDPMESVNRAIYGFNHMFDEAILRPITVGYRTVVPEYGRTMVSNFLENLYTPVVFANSVLQADPQNSFASFWRFAINTSFGVGGLFDVASSGGLHNRPADFGETLAFYGVKPGPYIVLPVIGPCDVRDSVGRLADAFINPFNYVDEGVSIAMWSATAINARSENMKLIDGVYDSSLDPYSTFRSGYTQKRAADIKRGEAERNKALHNPPPVQ